MRVCEIALFPILFRWGVCVVGLALPLSAAEGRDPLDWPATASRARQAIVKINVSFVSTSGELKKDLQGTGFIISQHGHILTAAHVVTGEEGGQRPPPEFKADITVHPGGETSGWKAEITTIGHNDVALIRMINAPPTTPIPIASSRVLQEGDPVAYAGYPGGHWSFNDGTITNISLPRSMWLVELPSGEGASGSPVIDSCGRAVGILTGTHSDKQRQQTNILPEEEFFDLIANITKRETEKLCRPGDGEGCVLSLTADLKQDYCLLLDTAIAFLGQKECNSYSTSSLDRVVRRQYRSTGLLYHHEPQRMTVSQLGEGERARVAECYEASLQAVMRRHKNIKATCGSVLGELSGRKPSSCHN